MAFLNEVIAGGGGNGISASALQLAVPAVGEPVAGSEGTPAEGEVGKCCRFQHSQRGMRVPGRPETFLQVCKMVTAVAFGGRDLCVPLFL